jgi:hypothetical protein
LAQCRSRSLACDCVLSGLCKRVQIVSLPDASVLVHFLWGGVFDELVADLCEFVGTDNMFRHGVDAVGNLFPVRRRTFTCWTFIDSPLLIP